MSDYTVKRFTFKSLENNQIGYVFDSSYQARTDLSFWDCLSQFQTYGDGMIQHSNTFSVPVEQAIDAMLSLWSHLETATDLWPSVCYHWPLPNHDSAMRFLTSLKAPKKETWVDVNAKKKTTDYQKGNFDTRFKRLPDDYNPFDIKTLVQLFIMNYYDKSPLKKWADYEACIDWLNGQGDTWHGDAMRFVGNDWKLDIDYLNQLQYIFRAFHCKAEAWKAEGHAIRLMDCATGNLETFRKRKETEAQDSEAISA